MGGDHHGRSAVGRGVGGLVRQHTLDERRVDM